MQRRDFLRNTLMLGSSGLLPGTSFAASYGLLNIKSLKPLEPIWEAALGGRWETVKEWLRLDPALVSVTGNYSDSDDSRRETSLLHLLSMRSSDTNLLKYLVSLGSDVNAEDGRGVTPLEFAVRYNSHVDMLKHLVSLGADVHEKDKAGRTLLHFAAAENSSVDVLKSLVSLGADVHAKDSSMDYTPLHVAAYSNPNVDVLKYLVSVGADVHAKALCGCTPLHYAADRWEFDAAPLKYLVSLGGDLNLKNRFLCSPMHYAVRRCDLETLQYLLAHGGELDLKICNEMTLNDNKDVHKYIFDCGDVFEFVQL